MNKFIIVFCSILLYLTYLIGNYFDTTMALTGFTHYLWWTLHLLAITSIVITPIIYRRYPLKNPGFFYSFIQWSGYVFFGFYSILIIFIMLNILGLFIYSHVFSIDSHRLENLQKMLGYSSLIITTIITLIGYFIATKTPALKKVKVYLPHLPIEFEGVKILQMSDVHVSPTIRRSFIESLVDMSNLIQPDIVVLTGDMVDGSREQLEGELEAFSQIKAPLGKFMVPGNHEYYWNVNEWIEFWQEKNFNTLVNQHFVIKKEGASIVMAGVHDYSTGKNSSPSIALEKSPTDTVKILLAHQPRSVYQAAEVGFDLQLSGHTHSGQYFPYSLLIYLFQPFVKGLGKHKDTWIYVNQGTGYWGPPTRFGVPPEVTLIELTREPVV